ncbi:MAG: hypothetical protein J2P58_10690, partial [Acidimicrobiaceae bacterium]|nr:hypothetical protein [Acidimicrobiaceae bacterium]
MKLVVFERGEGPEPGALRGDRVVPLGRLLPAGHDMQATMRNLIDEFENLRPRLEEEVERADGLPRGEVRVRPPLPRPGKILCCIGN